MQKGSYPSGIHPIHPRKRREDGWGTQAFEVGHDFRPKPLETLDCTAIPY
jgi:hypothetical protein